MAKSKTTAKVETKNITKVTDLLRKGTRAYIGLYGAGFQRAQMRFNQVKGATDGLFTDLVECGTTLETRALDMAKVAQVKTTERFTATADKVADMVPVAVNSRVAELEAEVASLNAKIAKLAKPAKKAAAPKAKMTTEKTSKAA